MWLSEWSFFFFFNVVGETPLQCAVRRKHFPAVAYLLENGANPNSMNNEGLTALHCAAMHGNFTPFFLLRIESSFESLIYVIPGNHFALPYLFSWFLVTLAKDFFSIYLTVFTCLELFTLFFNFWPSEAIIPSFY